MHSFTYYVPTKIIFGEGTVPKLLPELQADAITRVLVLTGGKSVYASGLYDTVTTMLSNAGIQWEAVSGIQPNPRLSKVREAVRVAKTMKAQAILPIGGGSVFDSAKVIALGALADTDVWEIMSKKLPITRALPVYGILTLSGTSSEVNGTGVITNEDTHEKFPVAHDVLIPRAAVVDPTLQYTVPLQQIRHCGMDALSHVLEAYFEGLDTTDVIIEHCEAYARGIIRCLRALPGGLHDYKIRSELAFCSIYAHSGWASIGRVKRGDFSSHRIGHAVGGLFDVPHGVTLGIIMPAWMQHMYDQGLARDIFARFATHIFCVTKAAHEDLALAGVLALRDFVRQLDMPTSLCEVGITADDIPALTENAARTLPFGCVKPMDQHTIEAVLRLAL